MIYGYILAMAILFSLFLMFPAQASLTGSFSGAGSSLMHKSGNVRKCSNIFFTIKNTAETFELLEGGYACEDLQASLSPFVLKIKEGKIFSDGQEVGTISDHNLNLLYSDIAEGFTYHWQLEEKSGEIQYLEEWSEAGKPALTIKGLLKKAIN